MHTYSPKILMTGGNGQLAQAMLHHPLAKELQLIACSHLELDITKPPSITAAIKKYCPDFIINTAAYTAVDKAEQEVDRAMLVNHHGAKNLAIICNQLQLPLVHCSTDYVFDGQQTIPYHENDPINPINIYGLSKWLGEQAIRLNHQQHIILRLSGIFSAHGNNFLKKILQLAKEKPELHIVSNQWTCPTDAVDVAKVIFTIIKNHSSTWGTYHYCNTPATSWYHFAKQIIHNAKSYIPLAVKEIKAISTDQHPTLAQRPIYSVFNCEKIFNHFAISQSTWENGVRASVQQLVENKYAISTA